VKENWEIHWKDYYTILQIHPLAEPEVAKAAYIKLANKYAPDKNPNINPDKMKDLNEAFEIISNPEKRGRYYVAYLQKTDPRGVRGDGWTMRSKPEPKSNSPYTTKPPPPPQPKQKSTPNVNPKNKLTLDEQIALLFSIASHDKNIYFRRKDWERKVKEVKEWIKNYKCKYPLIYKGGVSGIGLCPYCKQNYVLENMDASVRQCVNPNCDYVFTPEYDWGKQSKHENSTNKEEAGTTAKTQTSSHPQAKEGLGDLHTKGKYTPDNSNLNPNIAKITSHDPMTIILIIIALCITIASWFPYIMSHNRWWLILCIPISIVCLIPAIIWFQQLMSSRGNK